MLKNKTLSASVLYIPKILQNALFSLLLFSSKLHLNIRNRMGYYSFLNAAWPKKSSCLKQRILKYLGYISFLSLIACTSIGPAKLASDRFNYNQAMNNSSNQELLMNMVRLRYNESPMVMKIGNISGSTNLQRNGSVAGLINFRNPRTLIPGFANTTIEGNAGINYTDNPIISYTPLDDQRFTQAFLSALDLSDIYLLLQSSWSIPRVMRVGLQRVGNAHNAPSAARPTSSHVPQYQNFIDMTYVLRRMQLDDALTVFYSKKGHIEELTMLIRHDYRLTAKERTILRKAGVEIYQHQIIFTNVPAAHKVYVVTRSMLGILNYLSKGMLVPPEDAERQVLTQTVYANGKLFDWQNVLNGMMKICYSHEQPRDAYLSIPYRGRWYYIKDSDSDSKQTLILLSNMAGLVQTAPQGSQNPPGLARTV